MLIKVCKRQNLMNLCWLAWDWGFLQLLPLASLFTAEDTSKFNHAQIIRPYKTFSRTKKIRRREHPMIPAHSHFHTCESIGNYGCECERMQESK